MSKQCREIEATFLDFDECTRAYSVIINAMTTDKTQVDQQIGYTRLRLEATLHDFRKIKSGFIVGAKCFRKAVERIGSVVQSLESGSDKGSQWRAFPFNSSTPKVVEDVFGAFSRIATTCQELVGYYGKFIDHLNNVSESLESLHPSGEEVQVMARLWDEHSQHTASLKVDISGFEMHLNTPIPYDLPYLPPLQSTSGPPPQGPCKVPLQPQPSLLPTPVDAISGAGAAPAVASRPADGYIPVADTLLLAPPLPLTSTGPGDAEPSLPPAAARPTRTAFLWRLFYCINLGYFSQ
ncbi:hypothetical protein P691DRAFT_766865 [Macrolepiota fuliginosa MF-IS2]|uniref:Uncharacterized protein n=1 Tax=Macrolepiota fuliginosa MF-IS2 TaxID=1400762 RepID=A0A9P5X0C3_9AGAR|nr:hypothetical protein P691DRAFT_766865 [Macrolepiota fuliginosa MF-IS2]